GGGGRSRTALPGAAPPGAARAPRRGARLRRLLPGQRQPARPLAAPPGATAVGGVAPQLVLPERRAARLAGPPEAAAAAGGGALRLGQPGDGGRPGHAFAGDRERLPRRALPPPAGGGARPRAHLRRAPGLRQGGRPADRGARASRRLRAPPAPDR